MIGDDWREMVLNVHNDMRRRLAKGLQAGQNGALPYAKNMKQLYWDCTVENISHTEVAKCPGTAPNVAGYGVSFDSIPAKGTCNTTAIVETRIKTWWKDGAKKQANQAKVPDNNFFSQMANALSTIVACSYQFCSGSLALLCLYNNDGNAAVNLYENGAANEICASCTQATDCINSLCNEPPAAGLYWEVPLLSSYTLHTRFQETSASGWAKDAKLIYAKPSSAMPALTYDCGLENTIMTQLKDCAGTAATTNKAENFVAYGDYQSERADVFSKVVEQWWSPLADIGNENNLYSDSNPAALKTYINMAHKSATSVGCGVQLCQKLGQTLVQCAYEGVPIIADDDPIYPVGKPCSKCRDLPATSKCSALGGLCVA
ncbi:SCP-like protein [Ancylostoma caninum]|uniref:SCP-like protein n=1 Tax=Ancylostoma caninum TaxID=29170 RepID=A0A368GBD8_ANCCA|nr:SCP-like protein [Ancylostoma caninum]